MTLCALADTDKRRYTYSFLMTALARHDRLAACFTAMRLLRFDVANNNLISKLNGYPCDSRFEWLHA
jgi:hypothetical protein